MKPDIQRQQDYVWQSLAKVEGQEYILVTAGVNQIIIQEPFHVLDAENIYSQIGTIIQSRVKKKNIG